MAPVLSPLPPVHPRPPWPHGPLAPWSSSVLQSCCVCTPCPCAMQAIEQLASELSLGSGDRLVLGRLLGRCVSSCLHTIAGVCLDAGYDSSCVNLACMPWGPPPWLASYLCDALQNCCLPFHHICGCLATEDSRKLLPTDRHDKPYGIARVWCTFGNCSKAWSGMPAVCCRGAYGSCYKARWRNLDVACKTVTFEVWNTGGWWWWCHLIGWLVRVQGLPHLRSPWRRWLPTCHSWVMCSALLACTPQAGCVLDM